MYVDILIFRKDQEEHNRNLRAVSSNYKKKKKKKLNKVKCDYGKTKFVFFGHVFSGGGISPDPNKVEGAVILKCQPLLLKHNVC